VQFLFTLPQTVSGQLSEISIVANHRLSDGGVVDAGIFHGNSVMFDRDYASISQPSVRERGTIMAINRSFDTFVGENLDQSTRDRLETEDFLVYRSRSGGWPQEGVTRVFVNELEALPEEYIAFPEDGLVAFRRRLSENDEVGLDVQMPAKFRVGLKISNPSTAKGKFDEFAYMYGITEDDAGMRPNNVPRATNLFVGSPVFPGGPLVANYTFSDPDGNDEDGSEISWFRDGALLPELRNLRTVTNSNLVAKRADVKSGLISKGQEWFFTVRPSDGKSFGPIAVSSSVTVSNLPPVAENLRIESMGEDPLSFVSSSGIVARFDFVDQDKGDKQGGSVYTWFVNGVEAKSGSSNGIAPEEKGTDGRRLLSPNNVVRVELVPSDNSDFGASVSSDAITMTGSPPTASDVKILPETPSASSILKVTYVLTDFDKGQDISEIAWFRNGQRVSELDNAREVNPLLTAPGQQWQAVVTPRNEFASGEAVRSNVALIRF
jgi:hypothetical protein